MKIFIIGSLKQFNQIKKVAEQLLKEGNNVQYVKPEIDPLYRLVLKAYKNILWCDKIIAIPKENNTYGVGVTYEIAFAELMGKEVHKWEV